MKRNFIFVFILLVTLSMVNAAPLQKRTTDFGKCPPIPKLPTQPEPVSVTISPDPVVPGQPDTFTVSGTLTKEITEDYKLVIGFADLAGVTLAVYVEDVPPTKPNESFKVVVTEAVPSGLPSGYAIGIGIAKLSNPPDLIGCALAVVGGSTPASYPIASYPIASYPIARRGYPIAEETPDSYPIAEAYFKRGYPIAEETPDSYPIAEKRGYPIAEDTPDSYPIAEAYFKRGYPIAEETPDSYPIAEKRGYPIAEDTPDSYPIARRGSEAYFKRGYPIAEETPDSYPIA